MPASAARFWDRMARRYAAMPIREPEAYEETLARVRARLSPADAALEVGCGTGTTALRLAPAVARYVATDISPGMIAVAREKAAGADPAPVFEVAPAEGPAPGGPFDVVLAFNLLHLLPDPAAGLAALAGRVAPGGLLITKTICFAEAAPLIRLAVPALRAVGLAPRIRFLRVAELEAMIERAGFTILETATLPPRPPSRFVVARRA